MSTLPISDTTAVWLLERQVEAIIAVGEPLDPTISDPANPNHRLMQRIALGAIASEHSHHPDFPDELKPPFKEALEELKQP